MAASTGGFEITVFRDGVRSVTLGRVAQRRRGTQALARTFLGSGLRIRVGGQAPCTIPADMLIAVGGVAPEIPAYESLVFDPDGRIWATHFFVQGDEARADVYDPHGGYLGTLSLGDARPIAFLGDGRLMSLEQDHDGVSRIVIYQVQRQ